MQPAEKSPAIVNMLEKMAQRMYGRSRLESITNNICVACGQPATSFDNESSRNEFALSGLCQACQNKMFGE